MKWLRRTVFAVLIAVVLGYVSAGAYMSVFQRSFQYSPEGKFLDLGETLLRTAEVVEIPTSNNERIRGWYAPPQVGKPLIVYYKGNADSFSDEHVRYEQFVEAGFGFLAFDYRGFPASPGILNQDNVLKDAIAAFAFAQNKGFPLVIWGARYGTTAPAGAGSFAQAVRPPVQPQGVWTTAPSLLPGTGSASARGLPGSPMAAPATLAPSRAVAAVYRASADVHRTLLPVQRRQMLALDAPGEDCASCYEVRLSHLRSTW